MEQMKTYGKIRVRPDTRPKGADAVQWDMDSCFSQINKNAIPWNQKALLRQIAKRYQKTKLWDREQLWAAGQLENQFEKIEKRYKLPDRSVLIGAAFLEENNHWLLLLCDGVQLSDYSLLRYPHVRIGNRGIYVKDPHSGSSSLAEPIVWEKHQRLYGLIRELSIAFRSGKSEFIHPLCDAESETRYAYLQLLCLVQREADIVTGWGLNRLVSLSDALRIPRGFAFTQLTLPMEQHEEQKLSELLLSVSPEHYPALFWDALTMISYGQSIRKTEQLPSVLRTLVTGMKPEQSELLLQSAVDLLPKLPDMYQLWEISDFCTNSKEEKNLYHALYAYYASAAAELKGEYIYV